MFKVKSKKDGTECNVYSTSVECVPFDRTYTRFLLHSEVAGWHVGGS